MGNSLAVQWLGLGAFTAKGTGWIPGQGTKILRAVWRSQKKKKNPLTDIIKNTFECYPESPLPSPPLRLFLSFQSVSFFQDTRHLGDMEFNWGPSTAFSLGIL